SHFNSRAPVEGFHEWLSVDSSSGCWFSFATEMKMRGRRVRQLICKHCGRSEGPIMLSAWPSFTSYRFKVMNEKGRKSFRVTRLFGFHSEGTKTRRGAAPGPSPGPCGQCCCPVFDPDNGAPSALLNPRLAWLLLSAGWERHFLTRISASGAGYINISECNTNISATDRVTITETPESLEQRQKTHLHLKTSKEQIVRLTQKHSNTLQKQATVYQFLSVLLRMQLSKRRGAHGAALLPVPLCGGSKPKKTSGGSAFCGSGLNSEPFPSCLTRRVKRSRKMTHSVSSAGLRQERTGRGCFRGSN
ncbi:hypothetical protein GOODEAATRI_026799, partial [Goodea atripinnis]